MKTLAFLLLLILATGCAITAETSGIRCYHHRYCEGDTFTYHMFPGPHNTYYTEVVHFTEFKGHRGKIVNERGEYHWVDMNEFEHHSEPEHALYNHPGNHGHGHAYGHDK